MRISVRALAPGETDHEVLWSTVGLVSLGFGWIVARAAGPTLQVPCVVKTLTGWPCLTCGATRAAVLLADGHVGAALRMNPLVTAALLGWAAFVPYGIGAAVGWWPRVGLSLGPRGCTELRMAVVAVALATWFFLVMDGR